MQRPVFAVVGHPNKGKSSIVSTLAQDRRVPIGRMPGTTKRCQRFPMEVDGEVIYELVDTPGFQRARRALDWMKRCQPSAAERSRVVAEFVAAHRDRGTFADECKLLTPILEGAGILYVVDGSVPYGDEYEPEMEILRWTGRPSMALINPIGKADHLEAWRDALGQYFKVVRVFNALMAPFHRHVELLRTFAELHEAWRGPLARATQLLEEERARRRGRAAGAVADMLVYMVTHTVEKKLGPDVPVEPHRPGLEDRYRHDLVIREQQAREQVEAAYEHAGIERHEPAMNLLGEELFSKRSFELFGLTRRQLVAMGAVGGAATGVVADVAAGGLTFGVFTAVGGTLGAAGAWWGADRLIRSKVYTLPLGAQRLVVGPMKHINFPHVAFGRARLHHAAIAGRNHADRSPVDIAADATAALSELTPTHRKALQRCFTVLRKGDGIDTARAELATEIEAIFTEDDRGATA